ncbi:DUF4202 domain-containing protein [Thalassotalea fusca]
MKLESVLAEIDSINRQDPNSVEHDGESAPKELIYGHQMSECLKSHWPDASEYLQIAVRAQHIKRWYIPRADYPLGKAGYLAWRKALGEFHATTAAQIMQAHGYSVEESDNVASILRKERLKKNPETQTLEDVACLVFLQHYFEDFAAKHSEEKIISILQKTWRKMSPKGHEIALTYQLPPHLATLVEKALS